MNNHSRNPEPTGLPSTLSGHSSLPSPDISPPADSRSTLTPPPKRSLDGQLTVPDANTAIPALRLPRTVGKYWLLEEVQSGGMGVVYKAHDMELDRIVALKMLKGGLLATDEEVVRFHQEARAIARLNHPNIVPVHEIGQEGGRLFFTMDFAWGGSLAQQQVRFVADPRAAAALGEKIARAVHYAHQRGILHRDLKPANILFDERSVPWVSDFGLAKFADASLELTRAGQVLGTPSYMAPEQAAGQTDRISPRTDVWALGVLLYELLTGQRPFKGGSQEEQLHKVRTTEPPRPRSVNRSLDRSLETVILKCLEKEPAQRYATAEALADDLARWLRGDPVLARPPSWWVQAIRVVRRYRYAVFGLAFIAIVFLFLALTWKGFSSSTPPDKREDPKQLQAMEEKLARLRKGEPVTLLGESGPLIGMRWLLGQSAARASLDKDQIFRIYAGSPPGMLELLPAALKRFRLRAQVKHLKQPENRPPGQVGIYFAHGQVQTAKDVMHCFFRVAFNDEKLLPTNQVRLNFLIGREDGTAFYQGRNDCGVNFPFPPAGNLPSMPWRKLTVEVTPEQIKTYWEGELIEAIWDGKKMHGCNPKIVVGRAAEIASNQANITDANAPRITAADLPVGEGIGLYIENGGAAFRSVVIEPLPE